MTRTGYHRGSKAETRAELGQVGARPELGHRVVPAAHLPGGDPQLHVHNLVLNKVQTERDGKWRKLDSRHLYRFQGAAAAIAAAVTERELARELGVYWVPRADGNGREIAGITQAQMDAFSSRRQTITEQARQAAAEFEARTGRPPDARQMYRIQKDIAYRTRQAKSGKPLDLPGKVADWEATARELDIGELTDINDAVDQAAERERARDRAWQHEQDEQRGGRAGRGAGDRVGARPAVRPRPRRGGGCQHRAVGPVPHHERHPRPGADPARLLDGWEAARRADAERSGTSGARPREAKHGSRRNRPKSAPRSRSRRAATPTRHSPPR